MTDQDDDTLVLMAEIDPELTVGKVQEQSQPPSVSNSEGVFSCTDIRYRDKSEKTDRSKPKREKTNKTNGTKVSTFHSYDSLGARPKSRPNKPST